MRKLIYILAISGLVLSNISCKDYLDEDIQGVYSSETFYKTEEQAINAVNAVYATTAFTTVNNCLWVFGDVASDDAIKGGNPGDQSEIEFIDEFETTPENGFVNFIWQHYYEGITRANNVIHYVPSIDMDDELKKRLIAEAKALRAYFYFNLVNIFGEIPLKTEAALSTEDLQVPLSSFDAVYLQIIQDLEEATEHLPVNYSGTEKGRITKGAVYGLLAKVHLFRKNWDKSLEAIDELESIGNYDLLPVYRHNFSLAHENNAESVIEFQHQSEQSPFEGSYLNQWFSPQKENGYYFNAPTESLVDTYEFTEDGVADPRLDYSIGREGGQWLNDEDFDPDWSPTGYLTKKHSQPLSEVPAGTKGDAGLNYTYMRYAEVLLIKAEALNESGRMAEALEPLNRIRKRARESYLHDDTISGSGTIPEGLLPDIQNGSQAEIREAIRNERRVELAMEFHRYFDLMRYGAAVAEDALSDKDFVFDSDRYFPIPQSELDANNSIQ